MCGGGLVQAYGRARLPSRRRRRRKPLATCRPCVRPVHDHDDDESMTMHAWVVGKRPDVMR